MYIKFSYIYEVISSMKKNPPKMQLYNSTKFCYKTTLKTDKEVVLMLVLFKQDPNTMKLAV